MNQKAAVPEPDSEVVTTRTSYAELEEQVLTFWDKERIFEQSIAIREKAPSFVFFEGPPTANGRPGIHHVIARTIKDLVCRYQTMKGFRVERKAGWDTHGLPVEIEVEKQLGLESKQKIIEYGVAKFNEQCRASVFKYKEEWDKLTRRIGFWVDLEHPYVTFSNEYIESVWWILAQFHKRDLLYEGHKIVPYCPRCGTGLSSHEVALGYDTVKDPSITVTMPLHDDPETSLLVWTTTPWTLISNAAVAVGADIEYVLAVKDEKKYILAAARAEAVLKSEFEVQRRFKGRELVGKKYAPLFEYFADTPEPRAFTVLEADFVSTEDGTGIVHIAPAFGADDYELGCKHGLPVLQPVKPDGTFELRITPYARQFVKDADKQIAKDLKGMGRLFDLGQIEHTYPFCWRCASPLLYYARRSWYIKTAQFRERFQALNNTIHWFPPEIGAGRFGEWLANNVDWALSRERFWGTPLPIWVCAECGETTAVESVADLQSRGSHLPEPLDLHKPYVDEITISCPKCKSEMKRVPDVIDVWFDSGAMPFAQWHYPFENKDRFDRLFPADFITEGVDQTRGWFYSLHAISALLMDQVSFKNCLVMEFIVDKQGRKMSKTRGNAVDPWQVISSDGADALRWYMLAASQPWLPTRFDTAAVTEVRNRFFDTWKNTLAFYQLYAGIDAVETAELLSRADSKHEFDRWILSRTASVIAAVDKAYGEYDLTRAVRTIADFVVDDVSNWYVRLNRRRFWGSENNDDKWDAFATLAKTLLSISQLAAPPAPMFSDYSYRELLGRAVGSDRFPASVHLTLFPVSRSEAIDPELEKRMAAAQDVVSLGRAARAKTRLKTRQPLAEAVIIPPGTWNNGLLEPVRGLIEAELNVKRVNVRDSIEGIGTLTMKPNFPVLGARIGPRMKELQKTVAAWDIKTAESYCRTQAATVTLSDGPVTLGPGDLVIDISPLPGYHCESDGQLIVGIDTRLTEDLLAEGFARELINRVQNSRKKMGLAVTDRINLTVRGTAKAVSGIRHFADKIKDETLAVELHVADRPADDLEGEKIDLNGEPATIAIVPRRV